MANPHLEPGALDKPILGAYSRQRKEDRLDLEAERKKKKQQARVRDGHKCRWPGCDCKRLKLRLEVSHIVPISLDGSDETENLILLCFERHQGKPSLHSHDLEIEKLTPDGADGLLAFYERDEETGEMKHVATEKYIGVSEPRT